MANRVIIESPFSAPTAAQRALHKLYLDLAMRHSLAKNEAPFASHLLYTHFLNDDVPSERAQGIAAGFAWMSQAELVAVYCDLGLSKGMWQGMHHARDLGIRIEPRLLSDWESELDTEQQHVVDSIRARRARQDLDDLHRFLEQAKPYQ